MSVVAAVLLAAGSASRMGLRPKCLLQLDGVPLLQRQLSALQEAGVQEVVVVLGHYAHQIAPVLAQAPWARWVQHPDPQVSQAASLQLGLRTLSAQADCVLVALADQPLVDAQDIRALLAAWEQRPPGSLMLQPVVEGQPGNPVLFARAVARQMLAGGAEMGGRQWQQAHPGQVYRWPSANPHYCIDVDSPEDIEALARRSGKRLCWPEGLADDPPADQSMSSE